MNISIDEFFKDYFKTISDGEVLLDVRGTDEFEEARIEGSKNIPHTQVNNHIEELNAYKKIYILCRRGARAQVAHQILSSKLDSGVNLICISDGGTEKWISQGYPIQN